MAKADALLDACDISQSHSLPSIQHLTPSKSGGVDHNLPPSRDLVARAVSSAVIPGLLASGRVTGMPKDRSAMSGTQTGYQFTQSQALWSETKATAHFQAYEIERFAEQTLDGNAEAATDYVHELCKMGLTPIDIMLGLLTPAIRLFGVWWVEDKRSFMDVTVGSIRLQQAMRAMMSDHAPPVATNPDAPVCMFTVPPREQHTFGVQVLDNIFRLQGWQMVAPDSHDEADVLMTVAVTHIDIIALSVATDGGLMRLGPFIAALRRSSANSNVKILIGGPAITGQPDLVSDLGADAMADDARGALDISTKLLGI
jgi:MerR family transcriptional regulator, light-induced transcriptional regulator